MSTRLLAAACAATALSLWPGLPAGAHVTLETPQAPGGTGYKAVFRISHGCSGSPTTRVAVQLPPGVLTARPQPKAGWTLELRKERLAEPVPGPHGGTIEEAVAEIVWSGGALPDEFYDEFVVLLRLPQTDAERMLAFPVVQDCESGSHRWTAVPEGGGDPAATGPAPLLRLLPRN